MSVSAIRPPLIEWIESIASHFGSAPRSLPWVDRSRFNTPKPPWCVDSDPLVRICREKRRIIETGSIRLASVLRYDAVLEERSPVHATADVVYEFGTDTFLAPADLAEIRDRLLALPSFDDLELEEEIRFANFIESPNQRGFGVMTPRSVSGEADTALTSLIVYRHFLPGAILTRNVVPIIVTNEPPRLALVVPKGFWPNAMYDWWLAT